VPSDWSLRVDGARCIAKQSLRATLSVYGVLLALTVAYYPLAAILGFGGPITLTLPILAMVLWVPRLANERRRLVMSLDPTYFSVFDGRFHRDRLLEVVILPHRTPWGGERHRVFITFATGELQNMIVVATERDVENARGHADVLARWLAIPVSAATSSPPRAVVRAR
jgi:hypothetical protein